MKTKILLPSIFKNYTEGNNVVEVDAATVEGAIEQLSLKYGSLRVHIYSENGSPRSFINIYVNGEDIKYLQDVNTILQANDLIRIIPAVTGGA